MTLLETAKQVQVKSPTVSVGKYTMEDFDLVMAWLDGQITTTQAQTALKGSSRGSNMINFSFATIKDLYKQGKIVIRTA